MSKFWASYASVSDDVRHKLVEEAWYGRRTTDDIDARDIPALTPVNSFYGDAQQETPDTEAFYGSPTSEAPQLTPQGKEGGFYGGPAPEAPDVPAAGKDGPEPGF